MTFTPAQPGKHLVLVGGGHAHVFVLEAFARRPEPGLRLTLVARDRLTPYSGMLPGHMAGIYPRQAMQIDLERLARRSGAALVGGEAVAFDRAGRRVLLKSGGALAYDWLSIDIGVTPDLSDIRGPTNTPLRSSPSAISWRNGIGSRRRGRGAWRSWAAAWPGSALPLRSGPSCGIGRARRPMWR